MRAVWISSRWKQVQFDLPVNEHVLCGAFKLYGPRSFSVFPIDTVATWSALEFMKSRAVVFNDHVHQESNIGGRYC